MDLIDSGGELDEMLAHSLHDDLSGVGEFLGDFANHDVEIGSFGFAALVIQALWIFDQTVMVELGGAPGSVELNLIAVQALWWQNMELMTCPVLVCWNSPFVS